MCVASGWENFFNKAEEARSASDAYYDGLLEVGDNIEELERCRRQQFSKAARAGLNAGLQTPGNTIGGPPPTRFLEAILEVIRGYLRLGPPNIE
jgi:hypothetical protein